VTDGAPGILPPRNLHEASQKRIRGLGGCGNSVLLARGGHRIFVAPVPREQGETGGQPARQDLLDGCAAVADDAGEPEVRASVVC
jgi:hypothetical protein